MRPASPFLPAAALAATAAAAFAQQPQGSQAAPPTCRGQGFLQPGIAYRSVEQRPDGRVTFRICAPDAAGVRVTSSDLDPAIPAANKPPGLPMTRDETGIWSATTLGPAPPDTYRFSFSIAGEVVPDPQGTWFSEQRVGVTSVFETVGPEGAFQTWMKEVPHGTVSTVEYWSNSIGGRRRAHIYTPPGYMNGSKRYPVLYLVHGAGDSDDAWTSVGRANTILDNLISAGKAEPMIIVMPAGHTPGVAGPGMLTNQAFGDDLIGDLVPYVERTFRVIPDADHRAMAGLSMGGAHTLNFGLTRPDVFRYVGLFSMGLGLQNSPFQVADYEARNAPALSEAAKAMKLVYYAVGKEDFVYPTVVPTRALFDKHGVKHVYNESAGGHTWINWRRYLHDFAPLLFR